ncbi:hypothetical protein [Jeongeupia sp. USM3]|uniref:hypothetical protein n=1 Tax=Jeongeupia sp. USM3 TaxID=1906741 RepID=UPI00089E02A1|nr:hypothetical protein [Jeongeupia sp. USM3]AOY00591.1 hypothetical protein BJP62_09155 [Jeongeupia sp. USM3]
MLRIAFGLALVSAWAFAEQPVAMIENNRIDIDTNAINVNQLGTVSASTGLLGPSPVVPVMSSGNTEINNVNINGFGVVSANTGNNALIQQSISVGANVQSLR